jgi:PAS domain S-box-containing protein
MAKPTNGHPAHASDLLEVPFPQFVQSIRDYAVFALSPEGIVLSWNDGAEAIKGYSASEIIGSHFSRFYDEERIATGWPQHELERAAAEGRFEDESWRVRKDGSRFWANVIITAIHDQRGELMGFSKITRDLTERRESEAALAHSEERFRALVEGVKDYAIFMVDTTGHVATWNLGAQSLKGFTSEEIVGSHIRKFYAPDAVKRGWPEHELSRATVDGRFEDEGWRVRKDGSRFWANVIITAIRDRAGTLVGFSKITRDLTERRQHEQQLSQSEARLKLLVEGVTDYAIIMLSPEGFVTSWNSGARKLTGYAAAHVMGKHFSFLYPSEDTAASKPWQHLIRAEQKGRSSDEGWRVRKDGSQFWANVIITAVKNSEGQHTGFVHVAQDLSERRNAENLAETAKKVNEFIAMLAHELRNPLAPIRNAVELMGRKGLSDPTLEAMRQTIDRQSSHLARIIDELLDVNRIARGQLKLETKVVDLREVVARSVESSRALIDSQSHKLEVQSPADAILVRLDTVRMTQAIVNLLNNAARYSAPAGRIELTVVRRQTDVLIRVRDSGYGLRADNLEKVFDLFTQIDTSVSAKHGGLGVGLALVRRVVELHGGSVTAKSEGVGKGSEFTIRLPLPVESLEIVAEGAAAESALPRFRVLVADDNKDAADSLQQLIQSLGQDVFAVYDGRSVLDAVQRFSPDVVILDIGMPGMSGYQVADAVRNAFEDRVPTLVAVTGWGQEADVQEALLHGFRHHFVKPVGAETLHELLSNIPRD